MRWPSSRWGGLTPVALDLASVIEQGFGVDVCIASLGEGFDGLAVATQNARLILAAVTPVPYRQRFTMAHELGHLLSGDDQGVHQDQDVLTATGDDSERRSNAFAAAFLMPEPLLRERVQRGFDTVAFATLAIHLMVSPISLAIRLSDLHLIDAMACDAWKQLTATKAAQLAGGSVAVADAARVSTQPRHPGLLSRDLYTAYLAGRTTLRPYANLIGVDSDTLRDDLERSGEHDR